MRVGRSGSGGTAPLWGLGGGPDPAGEARVSSLVELGSDMRQRPLGTSRNSQIAILNDAPADAKRQVRNRGIGVRGKGIGEKFCRLYLNRPASGVITSPLEGEVAADAKRRERRV